MNRRLLSAFASLLVSTLLFAPAAQAETKTLKIVPHADLKVLDPTYTTAYITRNFGYLVYDTLFALDAKGQAQPQMVDTYKVSDDKKEWTFTLRAGLKFSDGSPVTSADCVASLKRWAVRDNIGQAMTGAGGEWSAVDEHTFKLTLKQPFGLVLDGLAKVSSFPAFILPARLATQSASKPLNEVMGSGPYIFKRDEWVPGSKVVYVRNPNYIGPKTAPSGLAGDKTSKFDRVEWIVLPDSNSAVAALKNSEVDLVEQAPADYISTLREDKDLKIGVLERNQGYIILNHSLPPFNNVKARQAVAHMIDQNRYTSAMGYPDDLRMTYCPTYFICGGPNESEAGSAPYKTPDPVLAKKLLAESGYKGEKVVVLLPTDLTYINSATLVLVQAMQDIGFNLDVQSMDWASMTSRRARKETVDKGGWNVFLSSASEFNVNSPISNTYLGAACGNSLPGWPCDEKLDALRTEWIATTDAAHRQQVLDQFQTEAFVSIPYLPIGQFSRTYAARKELKNTDLIWSLPNLWVLDK
jgi:peptide/nickel transport system substrate-binding protein